MRINIFVCDACGKHISAENAGRLQMMDPDGTWRKFDLCDVCHSALFDRLSHAGEHDASQDEHDAGQDPEETLPEAATLTLYSDTPKAEDPQLTVEETAEATEEPQSPAEDPAEIAEAPAAEEKMKTAAKPKIEQYTKPPSLTDDQRRDIIFANRNKGMKMTAIAEAKKLPYNAVAYTLNKWIDKSIKLSGSMAGTVRALKAAGWSEDKIAEDLEMRGVRTNIPTYRALINEALGEAKNEPKH